MSNLNDLLAVARGGDPAPPPEYPKECDGCDKFEVDDIYLRHKYWCWPGDGSVINITGKKVCVLVIREERKRYLKRKEWGHATGEENCSAENEEHIS